MKVLITLLIIVTFLSGCATPTVEKTNSYKESSYTESNIEKEEPNLINMDSVIDTYKSQYESDFVLIDAFVEEKFVLVNENQITEILYIPTAPQIRILPRDSITRIENNDFGEFARLKITDRTNSYISIIATKEYADELMKLIGGKTNEK